MPSIIEIKDLTFSYPRTVKPALRDINLSIETGKFVAVIGPTGAGKSTFCYCFNGAVPRLFNGEMSGSVVVAGFDTYENEIPILAEHVGLVVQNARSQLFNVTVREEVAFGCENLGIPREEIRRRMVEALDFVGLSGFEDRQPSALSGGQQQRVAIACVLAMQPEVLVLDEPTSELDPIGSEQVMQVISRLNTELGKTIILVTHDMDFVTHYADRVIVMNDGKIIEDGTPRSVFSQAELLRRIHIRPPQVSEVALELKDCGIGINQIPINLEEAVVELERLRHAH